MIFNYNKCIECGSPLIIKTEKHNKLCMMCLNDKKLTPENIKNRKLTEWGFEIEI